MRPYGSCRRKRKRKKKGGQPKTDALLNLRSENDEFVPSKLGMQ